MQAGSRLRLLGEGCVWRGIEHWQSQWHPANFECQLVDTSLVKKYSLFVFEVVKAHVPTSPKFPTTIHYRGEGLFMVVGRTTSKWRKGFRPEML